jgi:hypothetical protein
VYKMDSKGSAELLNSETNHAKHASSDSLASDSKSSSLNSKLGQESVSISDSELSVACFGRLRFIIYKHLFWLGVEESLCSIHVLT